MAAKRITQVNINWAAFMERAPPTQAAQAHVFKTKVDGYVRKLAALPEKPPAIDWDYYKARVGVAGMVDDFKKKYESLSIPFPNDTVTATIEKEKQERVKEAVAFIKDMDKNIADLTAQVEKDRKTLPLSEMTLEDFSEAYPQFSINTFTRPSHWPHEPIDLQHGIDWLSSQEIPEEYLYDTPKHH